jgi:rhodanese-related sulfurtransferase
MCQSGSRAPIAAAELHEVGYKEVYTQYQGFEGLKAKDGPNRGKRLYNGWKNAGLPWIYAMETAKMYFNFAP